MVSSPLAKPARELAGAAWNRLAGKQGVGHQAADWVQQGVTEHVIPGLQRMHDEDNARGEILKLANKGLKLYEQFEQIEAPKSLIKIEGSEEGLSLDKIDREAMQFGAQFAKGLNIDPRIGIVAGLMLNPIDPLGVIGDVKKLGKVLKMNPKQAMAIAGGMGFDLDINDINKFSESGARVYNADANTLKIEGTGSFDKPKLYGVGNRFEKTEVRKWVAEQIEKQKELGAKIPEDIERRGWHISDSANDPKRVQGIKKYFNAIKNGEPNPYKHLDFVSKQGTAASKKARIEGMKAPIEELKKVANEAFPNDPKLADELTQAYNSQYTTGFAEVQEAARRNGITLEQFETELATGKLTPVSQKVLEQFQAGHWRAVKSFPHPQLLEAATDSKIHKAATSSHAARIENAFENVSAGADVTHDINPYAARMAGIPRTWEQDFLFFVDRTMGYNQVPNWKADFNTKQLSAIEAIPYDMKPKDVEKYFQEKVYPLESKADLQATQDISLEGGIKPIEQDPDYYPLPSDDPTLITGDPGVKTTKSKVPPMGGPEFRKNLKKEKAHVIKQRELMLEMFAQKRKNQEFETGGR